MRRLIIVLGILFLSLVVVYSGACDSGDSNSAPDITSTAVATAKVGEAYSYAVQADDDDGDTLTFSLDQAPTGMTINESTGIIAWTPDSSSGSSVGVSVKVSDPSDDSDTQSFTITVTAETGGNSAPSITSTAVTTAQEGEAYSYTVEAVDGDGDTLTFSLDQAPTGMTIDASTGIIAWTPDSSSGSSADVSVRVSDPSDDSDTQSFTITVDVVNKYAVIYGISDYLDPGLNDLNFCDEDANSWYLYLSSKGYDCEVYGHLTASDYSLYSGTATEYNVSLAVRDMVAEADSNDYVAFIASGHSYPGIELNEAALLMHDYGNPEGGMDGTYWDYELEDDFSDCIAAQTFVYIDSCMADAMGEVFTATNVGHRMFVASCMGSPDSESWDYPQYTHGAWTYFYLVKGLQDASHTSFDLSQIFYWAKDQYEVFYTDVTGLGYDVYWWNNADQPVLHDSDPGTEIYL